MRKESFGHDHDVLLRFPKARVHARGEGWVTYLAERHEVPYVIVDSRAIADCYEEGDPVLDGLITVIAFADEQERDAYLAERDRRVLHYLEVVQARSAH